MASITICGRTFLVEKESRWDYADKKFCNGIREDFPVDQCLHSLFGASKVAADVMVQEYGRYFRMLVCSMITTSPHFSILTSESGCIMMLICGQRLLSTPTLTGF
jgi:hypothetical protein